MLVRVNLMEVQLDKSLRTYSVILTDGQTSDLSKIAGEQIAYDFFKAPCYFFAIFATVLVQTIDYDVTFLGSIASSQRSCQQFFSCVATDEVGVSVIGGCFMQEIQKHIVAIHKLGQDSSSNCQEPAFFVSVCR